MKLINHKIKGKLVLKIMINYITVITSKQLLFMQRVLIKARIAFYISRNKILLVRKRPNVQLVL